MFLRFSISRFEGILLVASLSSLRKLSTNTTAKSRSKVYVLKSTPVLSTELCHVFIEYRKALFNCDKKFDTNTTKKPKDLSLPERHKQNVDVLSESSSSEAGSSLKASKF